MIDTVFAGSFSAHISVLSDKIHGYLGTAPGTTILTVINIEKTAVPNSKERKVSYNALHIYS